MDDLSRVQFVTRHYWELHGIRWIILGAVALFAAFHDAGWISRFAMLWLVLPAGMILFVLTIPYYRKVYGDLRPSWHAPTVRGLRVANGLGSLVFMLCLIVDQMFPLRLLLLPLGFAFWLVTRYLAARPYRVHLVVIAAAIAVGDTIRLLAQPESLSVWSRNGFFGWLLVGCALMALGFFDHRLLARTLKPVSPEPEAHVHA